MADDDAPVLYRGFDKLELIWGDGFMSPGGEQEVARIVGGADLTGLVVLDFGCGAGGASVALVERHRAASVTGADSMPHLIDYCASRAERLGLSDRLTYVVTPSAGRLPFGDRSFHVVFSKDAILHVADKDLLFSEFHRVLRPGGLLLVGDWLRGEGAHLDAEVAELTGTVWTMVTLAQTVALVEAAGFVVTGTEDRQPWYAVEVREEVARFHGEMGAEFARRWGQQDLDDERTEWEGFAQAAGSGALSPGHVRGMKPS